MADQNQDARVQEYINSLKPEENATGATLLPDGEVVQVENDKSATDGFANGFWNGVKNFAKSTGQMVSDFFSELSPLGDIDNVQDAFEHATYGGVEIGEDNKRLIRGYYDAQKTIQDFEKNGLNNADDIARYNAAKSELSLYKFKDKDDEDIIKSNMYDSNIIRYAGLGRDEDGNLNTDNYTNTGLRIVRHGALQEEMGSADTNKFLNDVKQKVAEKLVQQGYQANTNPGGRASTIDEVMGDLDTAISTVGSLGSRIQAYTDVINASKDRDYQTANEYKRLTEGLVDMVGYMLADNTGRSSGEIMREYIDTVGNPMEINAENFSSSDTRGARNAKMAEIFTLGNADAYQTALLLKDQYALDNNFSNIKSGKDVLTNIGGALWNMVGLGGSAVGSIASGVFSKLQALPQYLLAKREFCENVGYKDNRGYNIPNFTSYVYGWTDSGMNILKSRVQKGVSTEQDAGNEFMAFVYKYDSGVDDIVASIFGAKGLSLSTKSPGLINAGIRMTNKVDDVAKAVNTASTVMKNTARAEKVLTQGEKITNIVSKEKGMKNFITSVGNRILETGKGITEAMFKRPVQEMKSAWGEFKILGGAGMNVQKAQYLSQSLLKRIGEETLQSAYFNGLTSMPYTEEDMWADVAGSIFGAFERVGAFKSQFLNIQQSSNNTKWAVFGMQELLGMDGNQIEKILKKASSNPTLLEELGQAVSEHIKPYMEKAKIATAKTVRTASQNLSSDVRNGLQKKVDDMVSRHDQTFLKALSESSDLRHNAMVKKSKMPDGSTRYEWADEFDEKKVSKLKRKSIQDAKDKAYDDIFAPKKKSDIDRILKLKEIVKDNLALYAKKYFPNSVEKRNGKWRFKKNISNDQQRNYFSYILHKLLVKEGLNKVDDLKEAIRRGETTVFGLKGKLGEIDGEYSIASLISYRKFNNFSDRVRYFINTMVANKVRLASDWMLQLNTLGAWIGLAFKRRCKKYKNINPDNIKVDELKELLMEYGKLFDESIAQEFKEEVHVADESHRVDIPNSIANKTYNDACKENPNLVNMDVDTFWRIVESDLKGKRKHELLKNYKKNDILYKDKIINLSNRKLTKEEYKSNIVFNSPEEEVATLGRWGRLYIPKEGYRIENGDVIMDLSEGNADELSYKFKNAYGNTGIAQYTVYKDKDAIGNIYTRGSGYGNNPNARIMWFVPMEFEGNTFELKDFKISVGGGTEFISTSKIVLDQNKRVRDINIDPKNFVKKQKIQKKVQQQKEVKGSEPVLLTSAEWNNISTDLKKKSDYRKFVDDTNPFVSRVIDKKTYKNLVNSKEYTDSDKFQIVSNLINLGKNIDEGVDLTKGFLGDFPGFVQDYVVSRLPDGSFVELKVKGIDTPVECVAIKSDDGVNNTIHLYDVATLEPVGEIKVGKEKGFIMIEGQRKNLDNIRYTTKLPDDAVKKFRTFKDTHDVEELKNFQADIEEQVKKIPDERKEVLDFSRKFFKELGFTNFNETLMKIYDNNLTKEEVVLRTLDNVPADNSFRVRAINKFRNFLTEAYADPEVIGRKLKYELNMADECQNYKNNHKNITLEDVELHKCLERYDEIKADGFVLNASEKEIADIMFGERKGFTRDELISVIGASLFEKPQKIAKFTLPMRLLQARSNRLIQFLTKDPESVKWPEDVKRNFLNRAKEFVDLTTHSVEEIAADVNTHPENYIDMLQYMSDDLKNKSKEFDITKDVKKRDKLSQQLEDVKKKYEELKKEYNDMNYKKRQWTIDEHYYTITSRKFLYGADMCDDIIKESMKMVVNALHLKAAMDASVDLEEIIPLLVDMDIYSKTYRESVIPKLRALENGAPGLKAALDTFVDAIEQKARFIRLSQNAREYATLLEKGTIKKMLSQATDDDFTKVMLQTLTGQGVTNKAVFSKEQFNKAMKQLKEKMKDRQIVVMGEDGIQYTRNMRDVEIRDIIDNFIRPKAKQILYGHIGGSTSIGEVNHHALVSIIYSANNQNIVGLGHEWFHSVIHTLCNSREIQRAEQLLDSTYIKYKGVIDAQAQSSNQLQKYIDKINEADSPKVKQKLQKEYERLATEEWLADRYGEYVAGKLDLEDSAIIALFKMIWQRIQALLTPEITQFFDDIYEGRLSNAIPNRDLYAAADIRKVGVKHRNIGINIKPVSLNTLDKFISDESAMEYALNPITINPSTPMEKINSLIKKNYMKSIVYALQGPGVGRIPSVMGVDGKSFMTETKKSIKAYQTYETAALNRYSSIMNGQFADNIASVCDMQNKSNNTINYHNTWSGKDFTLNVDVTDTVDGVTGDKISIKSGITYSDGSHVNIMDYTSSKKANAIQSIRDNLGLVDGKFSIFQRNIIARSFVNTDNYKKIIKDIPKIVYKSVERNISIPSLPEYRALDTNLRNAITDCYRLSVFNNQIPHANYGSFRYSAYVLEGNPLKDFAYRPLEFGTADEMFKKKQNEIFKIINKYKGVDGIEMYKSVDSDGVATLYVKIDVDGANVEFSFHMSDDGAQRLEYQALPTFNGSIGNPTWEEYPLSFTKEELLNINKRFRGSSFYEKIATSAFLNEFVNTLVTDSGNSISLVGKTKVSQDGITALALYTDKNNLNGFDGNAKLYYTPNLNDAKKIKEILNKKAKRVLFIDINDSYIPDVMINTIENFKNKPNSIFVLTGGSDKVKYSIVDSDYLDTKLEQVNSDILNNSATRNSLLSIESLDKSVISDIHELDQIDLSIRRKFAELRKLEVSKRKKRVKGYTPTLEDLNDHTWVYREEEVARVNEETKQQRDWLETNGFDYKNRTPEDIARAEQILKESQMMYNLYLNTNNISEAKKESIRRKALEFYLNPEGNAPTKPLLRPDTETMDEHDKFVKDTSSQSYYMDVINSGDYDTQVLAEDIFDALPETHKILIEGAPIQYEDFLDEDIAEKFIKAVKTQFWKEINEKNTQYIPKDIREKLGYKSDNDQSESRYDEEGNLVSETRGTEEDNITRDNDIEFINDLYKQYKGRKNFDKLSKKELDNIYDGLLSKDPSEVENAKMQLYYALEKNVTERVIDYMQDKLWTTAPISDLIEEAKLELSGIIERLPVATLQKQRVPEGLKKGTYTIDDILDGGIWGGTEIDGVSVKGIEDRIKAVFNKYLDNSSEENRNTIAFQKNINSRIERIEQEMMDMEGAVEEKGSMAVIKRAFDEWKADQLNEQNRHTNNPQTAKNNVERLLRKIFPKEDYPDEITAEDVSMILNQQGEVFSKKLGDAEDSDTLGDIIKDENVSYGTDYLEKKEAGEDTLEQDIEVVKEDLKRLKKHKEEKKEEIMKKVTVPESWQGINQVDSIEGWLSNIKKEDVINISLESKGDYIPEPVKIAFARYKTRYGEDGRKIFNNVEAAKTIHYGRIHMIERYGIDISDQFSLRELSQLGVNIGSVKNFVGDFDYWLGDLPLNMGVDSELVPGNLSYTDCVEKIKNTPDMSDSMRANYENAAADAVWFNMTNTKSLIVDKDRFRLIRNHFGADDTKELLKEVNIAYELYRLKVYIDHRIKNKNIRTILNDRFTKAWNSDSKSKYIGRAEDGMYFKGELAKFLGEQTYKFSDRIDRNPLEVKTKRMSLPKQLSKYLNESVLFDVVNPSTDKNGNATLFVMDNQGVKNNLKSKDYIGRRCRTQQEVNEISLRMRNGGYYPVVINVNRAGIASSDFNENVINEVPYDKIKFIIKLDNKKINNINFSHLGDRRGLFLVQGSAAKADDYTAPTSKALWVKYRKEVEGLEDDFAKKVIDEKKVETKPEEVEVDESSVIEEEDVTKKFSEQEAEAIKLQLYTYSKNWLKDIQLWDEVEKKFHKVYAQKYGDDYYLVAERKGKSPNGTEYQSTDIIATITDSNRFYKSRGLINRVSDKPITTFKLNTFGDDKYNIWPASKTQDLIAFDERTKGYSYPILLVKNLKNANIKKLQFSNYEFDVIAKSKGYKQLIDSYLKEFEKYNINPEDLQENRLTKEQERVKEQERKKRENEQRERFVTNEEEKLRYKKEQKLAEKKNELERIKKENEQYTEERSYLENVEKELNQMFTESDESGYAKRTKENADNSDVTLAIAQDLSTSGEKLTKKVAGNKYVSRELKQGQDNSPAAVAKSIKDQMEAQGLPTENIVLNVAGNGIYTFKTKFPKITQGYLNRYVGDVIGELQKLGVSISKIISGGQTGIDEAGIVTAIAAEIPYEVHAPKGFRYRNKEGKDIYDKNKFIRRFVGFEDDYEMPDVIDPYLGRNGKDIWTNQKGVPCYRIDGGLDGNSEHHFGNPFSPKSYPGVQFKTKNIKEAVEEYKAWLLGIRHKDIAPERRKFVIEQIESGVLDDLPIYYYTKTADLGWDISMDDIKKKGADIKEYDIDHPNHAMVLKKIIDLVKRGGLFLDDNGVYKPWDYKAIIKEQEELYHKVKSTKKLEEEISKLEKELEKIDEDIEKPVEDTSMDKQVGDSGLSENTQKQLIKQQVDYAMKQFDTIDLSGIELPDLSKRIEGMGNIGDNIFNSLSPVVVGKSYLDTDEVVKSTNEFKKKYNTLIQMVSGPGTMGEKYNKAIGRVNDLKAESNSLFNKQKLANDIADEGDNIKKLQGQLDSIEKNINTKIDGDVAYKNSVAYKNQLRIEELLDQAKKNLKPKKNKVEIQGQEGTTNKLIEVKPEYSYDSVIMPLGKMSEGFDAKNFGAKIVDTKKAMSTISPDEKNIVKTYGDFKIYPYNGNDVDFLAKIQDLKDEGNFVLMTPDSYSLLCAQYRITNKFPDVELVYERPEGNVAYFIKKELTDVEQEEVKEYVNEATSIGETTNNLSSYCNIR